MYALILTLVSFTSGTGVITTQGGFTSEQSCMVAARAWTEQMQKTSLPGAYLRPRALCVKQ